MTSRNHVTVDKGDYNFTRVINNTVQTQGAYIKVGMGMGPSIFVTKNPDNIETGGIVMRNLIESKDVGHGKGGLGYGYAVGADTANWTCIENVSAPGVEYYGDISASLPELIASPKAFVRDGPPEARSLLQSEFVQGMYPSNCFSVIDFTTYSQATSNVCFASRPAHLLYSDGIRVSCTLLLGHTSVLERFGCVLIVAANYACVHTTNLIMGAYSGQAEAAGYTETATQLSFLHTAENCSLWIPTPMQHCTISHRIYATPIGQTHKTRTLLSCAKCPTGHVC